VGSELAAREVSRAPRTAGPRAPPIWRSAFRPALLEHLLDALPAGWRRLQRAVSLDEVILPFGYVEQQHVLGAEIGELGGLLLLGGEAVAGWQYRHARFGEEQFDGQPPGVGRHPEVPDVDLPVPDGRGAVVVVHSHHID
jgi:hypothetical protein